MKLIVVLLCVTLFIIEVFGALARFPNTKNSNYPNKCYYEVEGSTTIILDFNTSKRATNDDCSKWTCQRDYTLLFESCVAALVLNKHCRKIPGDKSKPFPDCCPEFIC